MEMLHGMFNIIVQHFNSFRSGGNLRKISYTLLVMLQQETSLLDLKANTAVSYGRCY